MTVVAPVRAPKIHYATFTGHGLDEETITERAIQRARDAGRIPTGEPPLIREHTVPADGWQITVVSTVCENNAPPPKSSVRIGYIRQMTRVRTGRKRAGAM